MSDIFAVLIDGVAQLEYSRGTDLPQKQQDFLAQIDTRLEQGFDLGGEVISTPDLAQKAQLIALQLIQYIKKDDEAHAAAFCAWLATRLPDLKQVKIDDSSGEVSIELVFDEPYRKQAEVSFDGLNS